MASMFFQVHFTGSLRIFLARCVLPKASHTPTPTPALAHTHMHAHFDPSPLVDHCTHVLLIFLPIPGQQCTLAKVAHTKPKQFLANVVLFLGKRQKLAENFSDTGPPPHSHTHARVNTWETQTKSSPQNNVAKLQKIWNYLHTRPCAIKIEIPYLIYSIYTHMYAMPCANFFHFCYSGFFSLGVKM